MKKITLLSLLVILISAVGAQNLDDVKKFALLGQTKSAREAIEKYLSVEKNAKKSDGWYWKGFVYNQESKDTTLPFSVSSELKSTAFEALKKYRELDKRASLLEEDNNSTLIELYIGFFSNLGVSAFKSKDINAAFENFKKCGLVHDYLYANNLKGANGYTFSALDTVLVFYTAIAAQELKNNDAAAGYYKKLTDANVNEDQYLQAYEFLAEHYKNTKDKAAFAEIIAKGRKLFPTNEYWTDAEIAEAIYGLEKPELIKKYEELSVKFPTSYLVAFNTAYEMYTYINSSDNKAVNTDEIKAKFPAAMKKALAIKSNIDGNYMMTSFLYNNSIDLSEEARKLIKPADAKKKNELNAEAVNEMNQAIPYAETIVTIFEGLDKPKGSEKINYRQTLTILKNIYEVKKDAAKLAIYTQKLKATE